MSQVTKTVSLLLVGRDGNGKSSTANSILCGLEDDKRHFKPTSNSSSAEFKIEQASAKAENDREVTVTEIAGLEYPGLDYTGNFEDTLKEIEKTIEKNTKGFNAVIFVLKYGTRFTKQEKDALLMIKSIFGFNVLKEFGVIVMTYGDSFQLDVEEDNQTFDQWCRAQTGDVKTLFVDCNYRCVLFNNRTKEKGQIKAQREKLFSMVEQIPLSYTLDKYKQAVKGQTEILVQTKLPQLEKEKNETMRKVWKELKTVDQELSVPSSNVCDILKLSSSLKKIQEELMHLKKHLQDEDKETGVLKHLLCEIPVAEMRIQTKLKIAKQKIQVAISSETWIIVSANQSFFNLKKFSETVSIRTCSQYEAGKFNSSSLSDHDVSECGIILFEIRKTTPESHQVIDTVSSKILQPKGRAQIQDHVAQQITQAQELDTQQVAQAQEHGTQQVAQAKSCETQLLGSSQTSAVLDDFGHDKYYDDLENTEITFDTIHNFLKEYTFNNALCLISKYDNKLTKKEINDVMEIIEATFDNNKVSKQGILILTCDNDHLEVMKDQMFEDWCQEETGTNRQLLDLCGKRCVLLNPTTKDESALTAQKERLVSLIQSVAGSHTGNATENAKFHVNNSQIATESASPEDSNFLCMTERRF